MKLGKVNVVLRIRNEFHLCPNIHLCLLPFLSSNKNKNAIQKFNNTRRTGVRTVDLKKSRDNKNVDDEAEYVDAESNVSVQPKKKKQKKEKVDIEKPVPPTWEEEKEHLNMDVILFPVGMFFFVSKFCNVVHIFLFLLMCIY